MEASGKKMTMRQGFRLPLMAIISYIPGMMLRPFPAARPLRTTSPSRRQADLSENVAAPEMR
jgi:hypothetical protein